jgi:stage II sporulation protein AB (anti-sigma F factor)
MKEILNKMKLEISARSENESFARSTVASFAAQLDPTVNEIADLKTAVSEAVTNCVVHAYHKDNAGIIKVECELYKSGKTRGISVKITDSGSGIENIEKALQPFFTTKPDQERSGMGFTVMQSFMDTLAVYNRRDRENKDGTVVEMTKTIAG